MAFPRCEGIQYSRGSRLNPDVGAMKIDMKTIGMVIVLPLISAACATAPIPTEHWIAISGIDSATKENIHISMVFIKPSHSSKVTPVDTHNGIEQMAVYPKWRYDIQNKIMSVAYTNEEFEGDVISWDYKPSRLILEHGFSGPVTVIMEKSEPQQGGPGYPPQGVGSPDP